MADEGGAIVPHSGGEDAHYPLVRFGRHQYVIPKDQVKIGVKKKLSITLQDFIEVFGVKSSPSRSPEKWSRFITALNFGMVNVNEGVYPYVIFDVEGHPSMRNVAHFVPTEPAGRLFPALYEMASKDPEAHGLKISSGTEEQQARYKMRLDALKWVATDCQSSNNKSGELKPVTPNPLTNKWSVVPDAFVVPWCTKNVDPPVKPVAKSKLTGNKRKDPELPEGVVFRTGDSMDFGIVKWVAKLPVGSIFSTKRVGDTLVVTSFEDGTAAAVDVDEDAADAGDDDALDES